MDQHDDLNSAPTASPKSPRLHASGGSAARWAAKAVATGTAVLALAGLGAGVANAAPNPDKLICVDGYCTHA